MVVMDEDLYLIFIGSSSVDDMMGREGIDMGLFQTLSPLCCACDFVFATSSISFT